MALARKAGTIISVVAPLKADDSDLDPGTDKYEAIYKIEITGMGPIQDVVEEAKMVKFTVATGQTTTQIAVAAKAAVDAAIAAG